MSEKRDSCTEKEITLTFSDLKKYAQFIPKHNSLPEKIRLRAEKKLNELVREETNKMFEKSHYLSLLGFYKNESIKTFINIDDAS